MCFGWVQYVALCGFHIFIYSIFHFNPKFLKFIGWKFSFSHFSDLIYLTEGLCNILKARK